MISVSFKVAVCCKVVLMFFLTNFQYWFLNGLTSSKERESSGSILVYFIPCHPFEIGNWSFPKSAKIWRQSSFCEGSTVSCSTRHCTFLIWLSFVSVAKGICGGKSLRFSWFSCSCFWIKGRLNISAGGSFSSFRIIKTKFLKYDWLHLC